jgi:hypothetical protein
VVVLVVPVVVLVVEVVVTLGVEVSVVALLLDKVAFVVVSKVKFVTAAVCPEVEANAAMVVASDPLAAGFVAGLATTWVLLRKPASFYYQKKKFILFKIGKFINFLNFLCHILYFYII